MKLRLAAIVLGVCVSMPTSARTLTAVCKEPQGRAFGWNGVLAKGAEEDEPENLTGGYITIIWEEKASTAQVLIQASKTPPTISEKGVLVFQNDEQLSFVVNYSGLSVWMYSIYPATQKLVASEHSAGRVIDTGGALVKSFRSRCEMSLK